MKKTLLYLFCTLLGFSTYAQWEKTTYPYNQAEGLYSSGTVLYAKNFMSVLRSTDNGDTWYEPGLPQLDPDVAISVAVMNDSTLYVGSTDGIYMSSDSANTFTKLPNTAGFIVQQVMPYGTDTLLFIGVTDAYLYDLNTQAAPVNITATVNQLSFPRRLFTYGGKLYLSAVINLAGDSIYHTTDLGQNWIVVNQAEASGEIQDVAVLNNVFYLSTVNGLYKSTDSLQSFSTITGNDPNLHFNVLFAVNDTLYMGADAPMKTMYYTVDEGATYVIDSVGIGESNGDIIRSIVYANNQVLIAIGDRGIWRKEPDITTAIARQQVSVANILYPNPAQNVIFINNRAEQLNIYNALGQKVYSLSAVSSNQKIDISELTTGIYIVECITNTKRSTSKLTVE